MGSRHWPRIAIALGILLLGGLWLHDAVRAALGAPTFPVVDEIQEGLAEAAAMRGLGGEDSESLVGRGAPRWRAARSAEARWRAVSEALLVAKGALGALLLAAFVGVLLGRPWGRRIVVPAAIAGVVATLVQAVVTRQVGLAVFRAIVDTARRLAESSGVHSRPPDLHEACSPDTALIQLGAVIGAAPGFLVLSLSLLWLCSPRGEASFGLSRPWVTSGDHPEEEGAALVAKSSRWAAVALFLSSFPAGLVCLHPHLLYLADAFRGAYWDRTIVVRWESRALLLEMLLYGLALLVAVLAIRALLLTRGGFGMSLRATAPRLAAAGALLLGVGSTLFHLIRAC